MCLIKRVETVYSDGRTYITEEPHYCDNSINNRLCDHTQTEIKRRHIAEPYSRNALPPAASSSRQDVVVSQEPRQERASRERRYASEIGVRIEGWRPHFSIRRLDDGGYRPRRRPPVAMMPEAPMPPPLSVIRCQLGRRSPPPSAQPAIIPPPNRPTPQGPGAGAVYTTEHTIPLSSGTPGPLIMHQSGRRSPPPSAQLAIMPRPNRPTPQGPGAGAVYTTRDTIPSSSGTPSRPSSIRSRDAHSAVQHLTVSINNASVVSTNRHRTTPGVSRLRFDPSTRFRDSAYGGSSNISPIDAPKPDILSRSTTTSGRSANETYNYIHDTAVARRENYANGEEDGRWYSSGSREYRLVRRVRVRNGDPEKTKRKMQEDTRLAEKHQSQ